MVVEGAGVVVKAGLVVEVEAGVVLGGVWRGLFNPWKKPEEEFAMASPLGGEVARVRELLYVIVRGGEEGLVERGAKVKGWGGEEGGV